MSGTFFDTPAVRFSRRLSFLQFHVRYRVSLLFRWLTGASRLCSRISSRLYEAEFPVATQTVDQLLVGTLRGPRARDRASLDALRPNYNWMKIEDQYDISPIREKWPAFTRRLPQKGRQSPTPATGAGQKVALAENKHAFHRWKTGISHQTCFADDPLQRFRFPALTTQTRVS